MASNREKIKNVYAKHGRELAEMERNRRLQNSGSALARKVQANVPYLDQSGYIRENGIDRADSGLYRNNRDEFNRRVGATIIRNLAKEAKARKKK